MRPLRGLILDDSAIDATLVVDELQRAGRPVEYERVATATAMRVALERTPWDVVIADWSMPTFSGHAALDLLKELQLDLPFIVVSGPIGEEERAEMRHAAAKQVTPKAAAFAS